MHNFCYLCSIKRIHSERIALYIAPVGRRTVCLCAVFRYAYASYCFMPIGEREQYAVRVPQYIGRLCQTTATAIWLDGCSHIVSNWYTKRRQSLAHTPPGTRIFVVASACTCRGFACRIAIPSKQYCKQYQSNSGTITHNATQLTKRTYILSVS